MNSLVFSLGIISILNTYVYLNHPNFNSLQLILDFFLIFFPFLSVVTQYLVLHILPTCLSNRITNIFLFSIFFTFVFLPTKYQCVSSYFALQNKSAHAQYTTTYFTNPDTKIIKYRLSHDKPLNQSTIAKFNVAYRKTIV